MSRLISAISTILNHPSWKCFIACLCRKNDKDRAPKFYQTLEILRSRGNMGDLDDSPDQLPLEGRMVEHAIQNLLPSKQFDLIISHNPTGEYTRHLRHEEVSKAVINLWDLGKISTSELWTFAYEDGNKSYYPKPDPKAPIHETLSKHQFMKKHKIITEVYGFEKNSWEANTTPKTESFWQFTDSHDAKEWLKNGGILI